MRRRAVIVAYASLSRRQVSQSCPILLASVGGGLLDLGMSELPPLLRDQRKIDADHLKLLSIFHFVGAGLALLAILFLIGHYAVFRTVFSNPKMWENQKQGPPPAAFFAIFKWFYLVGGVWFLSSGVLNLISGLCLRAKRHRTFSMVVACINCLHIPFGTVLGVFTLVVLIRDSVRELYEA